MTDFAATTNTMSDEALAAFQVPLRRYGEHTADERAVLFERQRRQKMRDDSALADRGMPIGGRVRIAETYRRMLANAHWAGREGEIVRSAMGGDYAYVRLDPTPRERTEKVEMIAVRDLEPVPTVRPQDSMIGHNGGPPLDDAAPIRIVPASGTSLKQVAATLPPGVRLRASPIFGGYTIQQCDSEGHRAVGTLGYANHAQSAEDALAAFTARMEACRLAAALDRVRSVVGPRHCGVYRVTLEIDGDTYSHRLPFAGYRGYAHSKSSAESYAKQERRAAAAALIAYEAEHGNWRRKADAERAAYLAATAPAFEAARTAFALRVATAKPWNGKGMPTPAQLLRSLDLEDEAAALAADRDGPRVLILPCSATKCYAPDPMPARDRYTGPLWQTYRAAVVEHRFTPRTFVMSAEFGIIGAGDRIPTYDRRLDDHRAGELIADPANLDRLAAALDGAAAALVLGGALYRATVAAMVRLLRASGRLPSDFALTAPEGLGIGEQRAALRAWIGDAAPTTPLFTPGDRIEAQRRTTAGIRWETCEVAEASPTVYRVRFADGTETTRTRDSVRRLSAAQEAA